MKGRVQKFRSVTEMSFASRAGSSSDAFERFVRHCARFWAIAPRRYPRGVFRFRSVDEARAARDLVTRLPPR